jgi:hypothetical protein
MLIAQSRPPLYACFVVPAYAPLIKVDTALVELNSGPKCVSRGDCTDIMMQKMSLPLAFLSLAFKAARHGLCLPAKLGVHARRLG